MTIHWDETIDDALEFYKYYIETDSKVKDHILILRFLIPAIACISFYIFTETWNWGIIGLSIMWIIFTPFVRRRQLMNNAKKAYMEPDNFSFLGARELALSEEGFLLKTDSCETFYKWKSVADVKRACGYCFIDIEKQEILIIPEKRLTTEETVALTQTLNMYVETNAK